MEQRGAPSFDSGPTLAARFRAHAGDRTHLYGYAMRAMADDYEAGGPVRQICAGYEAAPEGAALQLRLLAGVFRLVLTGRAPELVPFYPCLGGQAPASAVWPVMHRVVTNHVEELHTALEVAPQTNEVGRSAALLAGLFDLVSASDCAAIRLLELGASGGLNLLLDAYCLSGAGWRWGPADSPVRLAGAIQGQPTVRHFRIIDPRGCDLHPVDITTEQGRLLLTSFVWPFDIHRHDRLAAALLVAKDRPPVVDRASAGDWLSRQLEAEPPGERDTLTVVWQSITQLYWPPSEVERVRQVLSEHGAKRRLGHVAMEYPAGTAAQKPEVRTRLWDPGAPAGLRQRLIGTAHDHGMPVRLIS